MGARPDERQRGRTERFASRTPGTRRPGPRPVPGGGDSRPGSRRGRPTARRGTGPAGPGTGRGTGPRPEVAAIHPRSLAAPPFASRPRGAGRGQQPAPSTIGLLHPDPERGDGARGSRTRCDRRQPAPGGAARGQPAARVVVGRRRALPGDRHEPGDQGTPRPQRDPQRRWHRGRGRGAPGIGAPPGNALARVARLTRGGGAVQGPGGVRGARLPGGDVDHEGARTSRA